MNIFQFLFLIAISILISFAVNLLCLCCCFSLPFLSLFLKLFPYIHTYIYTGIYSFCCRFQFQWDFGRSKIPKLHRIDQKIKLVCVCVSTYSVRQAWIPSRAHYLFSIFIYVCMCLHLHTPVFYMYKSMCICGIRRSLKEVSVKYKPTRWR